MKSDCFRLDHAVRFLRKRDPKLREVIEHVGSLKESQKRTQFEALVRAIVAQQLSGKAAETIFKRLVSACGAGKITAKKFLSVEAHAIKASGLSDRKASCIRDLAKSVGSGKIRFSNLHRRTDEEVIEMLCEIRGIGRWTAEMHLIFGMQRPDLFPLDDRALQNVMMSIYGISESDYSVEGPIVASRWIPYRSIACRYLYAFGDMQPRSSAQRTSPQEQGL